ncbi:Elf1-domain-containing protein [Basidiobolus meristosporus CBS 931.73]|uniref:Transcription elongation factor 1 homolog n=1 Tax=Basidiobolus meristosporus CBS 931.73 TaxID=1314790 RepID=A0A1Y1YJM4_9FUNG|nr:Elf1-domain-containing protein [Basidiobolus meristosporus CBS 931.73]|eukprot:ORX98227.1 Elf1-domain-containing protein [Basidiobolus meristosporus CBS 931.73]
MGKRKSTRKAPVKRKVVLDTTFDCLFCNHEKSISCRLEKESKIGHLSCRICSASFQCMINYLSEPIDVYSEWIDACDKINQDNGDRERSASPDGRQARKYYDEEEE